MNYDNACGLKIKTVTGKEFEVHSPVEYSEYYDTYYCAGQSWPSEIVTEILFKREEALTNA